MKKIFTLMMVLCAVMVQAADFTPGNIVAVLSGDGTSTTNSVPVSILEYNTTDANQASPIQTINLNSTTGSTMLTLGSNIGEGFINNSEDGKWLLIQGYDATTGLTTAVHRATPNKKSIVKIGYDGIPSYISLDYTNGSGQASRSVASVDGSAYWNLVGSKGIGYFTDQAASVPNASFTEPVIGTVGTFYRVIRIFQNKLYMMHNDILTYSNDNLPTTANSAVTTLTLANGGAGISCTGLQFFDLDATADWNGTGYDVLYIADGNGGLRKMSWVSGVWVLNQKYNYLGVAPWGYMGMAARLEGGKPTLYLAQSSNNALYANQIQKIVDNNGYNTVISPAVTIIATAPTYKSFRSIGFAPKSAATFTGSGNWSDASKWDVGYAPQAGDIIVGSGELTVDRNVSVANVTISAGAKLTLSDTKTLAVNSNFTINSDNNRNVGTFKDLNAVSGLTVNGTTTANQHLGTARNWYVSSPITNAKAPNSGYTYFMKRDETGLNPSPVAPATAYWVNVAGNSDFNPGTGYIALPAATGATLSFVSQPTPTNGKFNHGNITIALTKSGAASNGFNLIGNPYPSYLTWTKAFVNATTNPSGGIAPATIIEPSIYIRTNSGDVNNGGNQNWSFITYNASTDENTPALAPKGIIPPMQAFWVRAKVAGDLVLDNRLTRSHQSSNPLKAPAVKNSDRQKLRLEVSNGVRTDETLLIFDTNAADGYDAYDSHKYMEANSEVQIFTTVGTEKLVMNGMKNMPLDQEIGLGFIPGSATSFSIKANEISNLPSDVKVILRDNATMAETDLTDGVSAYTFTPATTSGDRFSVIFRSAGNSTEIAKPAKVAVYVFVNAANQLVINAPEKTPYSVYNAMGQLIENGILNSKLQTADCKLQTGFYVVKVANQTTRVIIK